MWDNVDLNYPHETDNAKFLGGNDIIYDNSELRGQEGYAMKPSLFMTNLPLMAVGLSTVRSRDHEHTLLLERRAGASAYSRQKTRSFGSKFR